MFKRKKSEEPKAQLSEKMAQKAAEDGAYHRHEVASKVSASAASSTLLLIASLLVLVGFAGTVGIASLWKFTHPEVSLELPDVAALSKLASGESVTNLLPPLWLDQAKEAVPDIGTKIDELQLDASDLFKKIPDADIANYMHSVCEQVWAEKSPEAITEALQFEIFARVPNLEGGDDLAREIVGKALEICPAKVS